MRRAGLVHDLGRLGVSNAIWDKRGPLTPARARAGAPPSLPHRADAGLVRRAGAARRDRRPAPRAARRLRLPARAGRRRADPRRAHPGRGRRLPGHDSSRARTARRARPRTPRPSCARGCARAGSTATRSTPCSRAAGHRVPRRRTWPGGLTAPRGRGAAAARARAVEPGDRGAARDLAPRPRATTSSTSTRRSAPPTGPRRACSRCGTASWPARRRAAEDRASARCAPAGPILRSGA